MAKDNIFSGWAKEIEKLRAENRDLREENERLNDILGRGNLEVECSNCGQRWITSLGTKFVCQSCGEFIHAIKELKLIKRPTNDDGPAGRSPA